MKIAKTRIIYGVLAIGVLVLGLTLLCYWLVVLSAKDRIFDSIDDIPYNEVGMVLGTGPTAITGNPNPFFVNRIRAVDELYKAGKIKFILISGDNSRVDYSEPDVMKDSLVARGIPEEVIYLDYAGFRTWDSVVRAKKVFDQTKMTVISQQFHNERSIFIGDRFGMELIGYNASNTTSRFHKMRALVRENFARVKIFIDIIIGKQPHFLGDPIEIGEGKPQKDLNQPTAVNQDNISIYDKNELRIYYPNYNRIDLVCETMPSPNNKSILMCCEAAFTGELLEDFKHSNIAGNHISNGVLHKGYKCKANTGCFAFYADSGTWEFEMGEYAECLDKAVRHSGAAFGQTMIIHNGADVHNGRPCKDASKNQYRALCELGGKLCIIDAKTTMSYKDFIQSLLNVGVKHAIYLDMGNGWNYSYYRGNDGKVHYIHNRRIKYTTNWITFYK